MEDRLLAAARCFFRLLNRFLMVPAFRLGLGPFLGSPYGGYILLLKTIGRKSGKVRYAPVNYAIINGNIYCLAGFGTKTHWYRNVQAHPALELILPSGALAGRAEEVTDEDERVQVARQVLKNAGFAGFFVGCNPFTASDALLCEKLAGVPVLRIQLAGIGNGASDPGGLAWVWWVIALLWLALRRFRRSP